MKKSNETEKMEDYIEINGKFNPNFIELFGNIQSYINKSLIGKAKITKDTKVKGWDCDEGIDVNICGIDYEKETDTIIINFTTSEE